LDWHQLSESALPTLIEKLEKLGCSISVVGLGGSNRLFVNLDGTNIYMTFGRAVCGSGHQPPALSLTQQLTILVVAMLTPRVPAV